VFGSPNTRNGVANSTISFPPGLYDGVYLLGSGLYGNHPEQTFWVNYLNEAITTTSQGVVDWLNASAYPGETTVVASPYRIIPSGARENHTSYVRGWWIPFDNTRLASSLTLPVNDKVVVVAMRLSPRP
jgi:hypothetical protein